jgi:uncharacterized membrane protein YeiB
MNASSPLAPPERLAPVAASERIETLDVLRGFALVGICVVNVEFFNRPVIESGAGMAPGLSGVDWLAAFVIAYFFTGKFWTIFSLLFGMGFAVMLTRAQAAGRAFLPTYLRRIGALALFGALHHVFIWSGDILFSYALGALFLLLVLFGNWRWMLGAIVLFVALTSVPPLATLSSGLAMALVFAGLVGLYLRGGERDLSLSLVALVPGCLITLGALLLLLAGDNQGVRALATAGALLLAVSWLARRFREPVAARPWRAGVAIYTLAFALMGLEGALRHFGPPPPPPSSAAQMQAAQDDLAVQAARRADRAARIEQETLVLTEGGYLDAVAMRAEHFSKRVQEEPGFAVVLVGVFLIGTWFVRSGVIANAGSHLPLFRKLALFGIPFGIGLGLLGSLVATGQHQASSEGAFRLASALLMLGGLPAALGYAAAVVLMLHSAGALARIRALAPFGRMALTNYLLQSVVFSLVFYSYGLGQWGWGRAWQVAFALALCALQVPLSHWWLARFRYGPVEWLWRALTYLQLPPMRRADGGTI